MDKVRYMQRLLARCEECGDCLLWTGPVDDSGCPRICPRTGSCSLRRRVWEMREGRLPADKVVVPSCGRPRCVEHLKLISRAEQIVTTIARPDVAARKAAASRKARRLEAKKLTLQMAREIRASSKTQRELAVEYGVAQSMISMVRQNKSWREAPTGNLFSGLIARERRQ